MLTVKHTLVTYVKKCVETCPLPGFTWSQSTSLTMMDIVALFVISFVKQKMHLPVIWWSAGDHFRKYENWNDNQTIIFLSKIIASISDCIENTNITSPDDLYLFCSKEVGETKWKCNICLQFKHGGRNQVRNHVESKHFPNQFQYNCEYCEKSCSTKKGLEVHISEKHRYTNTKNIQ